MRGGAPIHSGAVGKMVKGCAEGGVQVWTNANACHLTPCWAPGRGKATEKGGRSTILDKKAECVGVWFNCTSFDPMPSPAHPRLTPPFLCCVCATPSSPSWMADAARSKHESERKPKAAPNQKTIAIRPLPVDPLSSLASIWAVPSLRSVPRNLKPISVSIQPASHFPVWFTCFVAGTHSWYLAPSLACYGPPKNWCVIRSNKMHATA